MNTEVNGQKQSPPESSTVPPEPLTAAISDLRAVSEQAAQAIRERANVDANELVQAATPADVAHAREQLSPLDASVSQLTELVKELRADVDQLRTELVPASEDLPSVAPPPPPNGRPQFDQRGLLIALNMASNGASRAEAADYLSENLGLRDCDELLSAVYDYVASTRSGSRVTKPSS